MCSLLLMHVYSEKYLTLEFTMDYTLSEGALSKIHFEQNLNKYEQYWVGFLYGILSSGKIEKGEVEPLRAICADFLERFDDPDAYDLLEDLKVWPHDRAELKGFLADIISYRSGGIEAMLQHNAIPKNFFYGFLKGIACYNRLDISELNSLIQLCSADDTLLQSDPRVSKLLNHCIKTVQDLSVSDVRNDEICQYIASIVGDSFADTGVGLPNDIPQLEGMINDRRAIVFTGCNFVLTGNFDRPRKIVEAEIEKLGGVTQKKVTSQTDYLVLGGAGSNHYSTPNSGSKIHAAVKMRDKFGKLRFIHERVFEKALI